VTTEVVLAIVNGPQAESIDTRVARAENLSCGLRCVLSVVDGAPYGPTVLVALSMTWPLAPRRREHENRNGRTSEHFSNDGAVTNFDAPSEGKHDEVTSGLFGNVDDRAAWISNAPLKGSLLARAPTGQKLLAPVEEAMLGMVQKRGSHAVEGEENGDLPIDVRPKEAFELEKCMRRQVTSVKGHKQSPGYPIVKCLGWNEGNGFAHVAENPSSRTARWSGTTHEPPRTHDPSNDVRGLQGFEDPLGNGTLHLVQVHSRSICGSDSDS
jgi:hypothetical protein